MSDNDQLNDLINTASSRLNTDPEKLKNSINSDKYSSILKNLKTEDIKKLQDVLSDKQKTDKLLSSPQVQALIKMLSNNK